jgi:hypothetical protein
MDAETASGQTVSVLLGAGASVEAGVLPSIAMTKELIDRIPTHEHAPLLRFIGNTLAADLDRPRPSEVRWNYESSPQGVDVERLFAAVDLLIDRQEQPWSPFVATWHRVLESFGAAGASGPTHSLESDLQSVASELNSRINDAANGRTNYAGGRAISQGLARAISKAISQATGDDLGKMLETVRNAMLRELFGLLAIASQDRVRYLEPLLDLAESQGSLTIATLNYDRSIEIVAEARDAVFDTLIETWLKGYELAPPAAGIRLLKLHGSIDWVVEASEYGSPVTLPQQRIRKLAPDEEPGYRREPAIIFGEAGKLRAEGPFLDLLMTWARDLRTTGVLVVVGYSFRDPHVNELVARWFNADVSRRIIVVDPAVPEHMGYAGFAGDLRLIAAHLEHQGDAAPPRRVSFLAQQPGSTNAQPRKRSGASSA